MVFNKILYNDRHSVSSHALLAGKWRDRTGYIAHTELECSNRSRVLSLPGFDLVDFRHDDRR